MPYSKSSGKICAVIACNNSEKKRYEWNEGPCFEEYHEGLIHRDCPCLVPFHLYCFPKKDDEKLKWISILNRKDFKPSKSSVVCSIHFSDAKPTPENPNPSLHLGYERRKEVLSARRKIRKHVPVSTNKRPRLELGEVDGNVEPFPVNENEQPLLADEMEPRLNIRNVTTVTKFKSRGIQSTVQMIDRSTQWDLNDIPQHVDHSYCAPEPHVGDRASKRTSENVGIQTDIPVFTASIMSDNDFKFYTGLSLQVFFRLVTTLTVAVTKNTKIPFRLSIPDQVLLVLARLRLGLLIGDLSRRFQISTSVASKILKFWIPNMAKVLRELIAWLPRDTLRMTMPNCFSLYPKTTCIIDCTEVFMERSRSHWTRAVTYSNYKSHNTSKFLIAIAPNGAIMFVSNCYGGRASDKFITESSGFFKYLLPGDEIMADRGFLIEEDLPPCVRINVPAFVKGRGQLPEHEVTRSRRIANVRVHVERVIGRVKNFRILKSCIPLSQTNKIDDIIVICSALCNLQPAIIRDTDE